MPRYGRPSRFSSKWKKWSSARKIQRAYRKRRTRRTQNNQRYNRVSNKLTSHTIQGARNPKSLKNRVKALEVSAKKYHDTKQYRPIPILSYGTTGSIPGMFADDFLKVLPLDPDDTLDAGYAPKVALDNVRDGDEIYAKSVSIKFRVRGLRPSPMTVNHDASYNMWVGGIALNPLALHTRVIFTILRDTRPSVVASDGTSRPNLIPQDFGLRPMESITEKLDGYDQTVSNSMITCGAPPLGVPTDSNFGAMNCLLSYDSSRFKKIHQECIKLDCINPSKVCQHRLVLNKRLKFMVSSQNSGTGTQPNYPINTNYLLFLTTTTSVDPVCNVNVPRSLLALCDPPTVDKISTRLYFTD